MAQGTRSRGRVPLIAGGAVVAVAAATVGVLLATGTIGPTAADPPHEEGIAGYPDAPGSAWVAELPGTLLAPDARCTGLGQVWATAAAVVVATDDACDDPALVGLAADDGEPLWRQPGGAYCESGLWGGRIVCTDDAGGFTLDAASGQRTELDDVDRILGVAADVLVIRTVGDERVVGLATDGTEVFSHTLGDVAGQAVASSGRHLLMSAWRECVDDFQAGIGFCVNDLGLLDVTTGEYTELGISYTDDDQTPTLLAVAEDQPLVLTATDDSATIHDATGAALWSDEREVVFASGGVIAVRDGDGWVSLDPSTGQEWWRTSGSSEFVTTDPGHVLFIADGELRALDRRTGVVAWSGQMPQVDGVEVVRYESGGGRLWAWALADGGGSRWVGYLP